MKKTRIINNRPMVFAALGLMLGIFISFFAIQNKILFWIVLGVVLSISGFLFFKKNFIIAVILLFFAAGYLGHYVQYNSSYQSYNPDEGYFITAKVAKLNRGEKYDNLTLKILKIDGFKAKGQAHLRVYGENNFEIFDTVEFYGKIENKKIEFSDHASRASYGNGVFYNMEMIGVLDVDKNLTFSEKIRKRMTLPMDEYMKEPNKAFAHSLLFGDVSWVSPQELEAIRVSGLSHIFAVSGLHIGFVVAIFAFLMKKIRIHRMLSMAIMAGILFMYCLITAFPPSAVRAAIMAVSYLLAQAVYKKSDGLSSLAFASVVMLLISPRTLFSLSFIMSLAAVFGIFLFFKPIYNFFMQKSKNKFRKYVSASCALSLSANIFLLPLCLNVFGVMSLYFLPANLIVLPIVTVGYILLFVAGVLSLVWQGMGFLFLMPDIVLDIIRFLVNILSRLPYASLPSSGMGIFTAVYVIAMILISRYVLLDKQQKITAFSAILFVGIILLIIF
ncbi:MAG: ComEC/Rec2 family competence protein [Clostridia bacterium]|jgi:ComEC/Rec2-related protein